MSASVAPVQNGNANAAAATSSSGKATAAPTEVGWLFVPQYYTFLNNDPSKLHCFYSKRSTLVHGTEQEEAPLCIGQQQIHEKIVSLGFSNAKVYVSNVDSQASASGGIIIQVLGDMSNNNGPWRKFVQTFFLAEQPNGYFVLNDIFRYLKEDEELEEDAQDVHQADGDNVQVAPNAKASIDPTPQNDVKTSAAIAPSAAISAATSVSTAPLDILGEAQANGIVKPQEPTPAEPSEVGIDKKVTTVEREEAPALTKGETEASQAIAQPAKQSAPTPALNGGASNGAPALSPAAAAAAAAPATPKTWANLAASNATKWGSTVSAESRGISSARETNNQQQSQQTSSRPSGNNNNNIGRQVFIKNVIAENLPSEGLQAALEAKFGPMKECQVIASKAVAFGEFASVESARKAIRASSSEGGVKIGKDGYAVIIEEKRKPADRNSNQNNATNSSGSNRGGRGPSSAQGQSAGRGGRGTGRGGVSAGGRGGRGGAA